MLSNLLGVKQNLLLDKLKYFMKKDHLDELLNFMKLLSLSIIDCFVTNYAKKHYKVLNNTHQVVKNNS